MTFILGVGCKISDTHEPIWMKLWGCNELTLELCNTVFSTSGLVLKTGNWNFLENFPIISCNIFLGFLIFPKLKHFQIDFKSFRMPQAWIKTPKLAANRPHGYPAVFLPTLKMNAILENRKNTLCSSLSGRANPLIIEPRISRSSATPLCRSVS